MPEKLIKLVITKNRKAQYEFYEKYSVQMFRIAYRYVNNEQDAGSVVNSGFYKIFENLDRLIYHDEAGFIAWMKKIVINEALMFLRKRINYEEINDSQEFNESSQAYDTNGLELEDYYILIKGLPDDFRTVFNLYVMDGFSHKEIALKLNIKESSSRVYLTRARKILQKGLLLN